MDFQDVHIEKVFIREEINIWFKLNGLQYYLKLEKNDQGYSPFAIRQFTRTEYRNDTLSFLSDHIDEIWEKLKNHRNVRLRLLFGLER